MFLQIIKDNIKQGVLFAGDVTLKAGFAWAVHLGNAGHSGIAMAPRGV